MNSQYCSNNMMNGKFMKFQHVLNSVLNLQFEVSTTEFNMHVHSHNKQCIWHELDIYYRALRS